MKRSKKKMKTKKKTFLFSPTSIQKRFFENLIERKWLSFPYLNFVRFNTLQIQVLGPEFDSVERFILIALENSYNSFMIMVDGWWLMTLRAGDKIVNFQHLISFWICKLQVNEMFQWFKCPSSLKNIIILIIWMRHIQNGMIKINICYKKKLRHQFSDISLCYSRQCTISIES